MTIDPVLAAAVGAVIGIVVTFAAQRATTPRVALSSSEHPPVPGPYDDARARVVLASLPFAALLIDQRGVVRYVNPAAERIFRIDGTRSTGQALIAVIPVVAMERQVLAAIRGEASTQDIRLGDGAQERTFDVTVRPFEGGSLVIAADRTEMLAVERTRRDFVANVSHELRTPLSAIKLMVETVLLSDEDAEARRLFLPQIEREVERMIRLVEDLLELARSESGTLLLRRERLDLTDIASSVVTTFAQRSVANGVSLALEAPAAVYVDADRHRLTQVGLNLVDNALRHTPAGGTVSVEIAADSGTAILRVRDTGRGIPFYDLPHIFERFYVVDRSRAREHTGTGLGLSIARHLVEAHGGTLTASSEYGRGATFECRLALVSS